MVKVSPYRVQVVDRVVGLLEALPGERQGLTLAQLSKRLRLHKSTVYRLLMALEWHGLVQKVSNDGRYHLGLKFFELASKVTAQLDLPKRARPYLERLVSDTSETAHFCILDKGEVLYLEKVEASRTVRIPSIVGGRFPAHCGAAGKVLIAFLPEKELDHLVRWRGLRTYTPNTITTPTTLKAELQLVRERGYSVDNEEFEEGLKCIGAPVRDYSGKVIGSISIAGPAFRMTKDRVLAVAYSVVEAANELSAKLGYPEAPRRESIEVVGSVKTEAQP